MNKFANLLSQLLEGKNIKQLALLAGVERSTVYKAKRGERISHKAAVALAEALGLSPDEYSRFMEVYEGIRGENAAAKREERVKKFIEDVQCISDFFSQSGRVLKPVKQDLSEFLKPAQVITGQVNIRKVLSPFLEQEAAKKEGHIYIRLQPDDFFENLFFPLLDNYKGLTIEHVFSFNNRSSGVENAIENLDSLGIILPHLLCEGSYVPHVFYEDNRQSTPELLPYLVLTDECAMCISPSYEKAIFYRLPELILFLKEEFSNMKKKATLLVHKFSPEEYILQLENFGQQKEFSKNFYSLAFDPCLVPFFDEELLSTCACAAVKENRNIISAYLSYSKNIEIRLNLKADAAIYFTLNGVRAFLESGRLLEIPPQYYTPIPPLVRVSLFEKLLNSAKTQKQKIYLIREDMLKIPSCLSMCGADASFIMSINLPHKDYATLVIKDAALVAAFHEYLENLEKSAAVYSFRESCLMLQSELDRYKDSL